MTTKAKPKPTELTPSLAREIAAAVSSVELTTTSAWQELDALSHHTQVEGVETFEDEIAYDAKHKRFRGHLNVYVTLNYGSGPDKDHISEGFPGTFEGQIKDGKPEIEKVEIDTSSFYE